MEELKKRIALEELPAPLTETLKEQFTLFSDLEFSEKTEEADIAISGGDEIEGTLPRIQINTNKRQRLGDLMSKIYQAMSNPCFYVEKIDLGSGLTFSPQDKLISSLGGEEVSLTDKECDILYYLVKHSGRYIDKETILSDVWNYKQGLDTHTLETHIYRLRQKLEQIANGKQLLTSSELGYNLSVSTPDESGSIITYILAAIFLAGVLMATLSKGTEKSLDSTNIEKEFQYVKLDIDTIHAAVMECVQVHNNKVDINGDGNIDTNDNPYPTYPLYADMSYGQNGEELLNIKCPGAPTGSNNVFAGDFIGKLSLLSDTKKYETRYYNNAANGIYIRVENKIADDLWKEVADRLNSYYSQCVFEFMKDASSCADGCLYYWISRPSTTTIGDDADCKK